MMTEIQRLTTSYSYSTAVAAGDCVFLGLHVGGGDDFVTQLDNAIRGIEKTLAQFGVTLGALVKVNVWLKNIEDLPAMEKRFRDHFPPDGFPARMTSTTEFIEEGRLIMIDGVAYRGECAQ